MTFTKALYSVFTGTVVVPGEPMSPAEIDRYTRGYVHSALVGVVDAFGNGLFGSGTGVASLDRDDVSAFRSVGSQGPREAVLRNT